MYDGENMNMDGKSFGWRFAVNSAATKSSGLVVRIFAINIRPTVGKETSLSCTMYYGLCRTTKAISRCLGLSQDAFFLFCYAKAQFLLAPI